MKQILKDLKFLKKYKEVHSVLLYGSYAKNKQTQRSDIDICVVAPECRNIQDYSSLLRKIWGKVDTKNYDIRLFEELPLYIKISVINNHKIIFSKDVSELNLYFYFYRKLWDSQAVNRM